MPDCGCAGQSSSPPGTTPGSVNAPLGAVSSYGGSVSIPRGTCGPAKCPQPPTSDSEERQPYCPTWAELLTGSFIGRLVLWVEGCLFTMKSKCSGYIFYDANSEDVSVVNPPFVSSQPKETHYGMLAKVVPTVTTICTDAQSECLQEIRQEIASQVMGDAGCGDIVLATTPICGELPASEAGDADKQVRFDYMKPLDQEEAGCSPELRFLAYRMSKRGSGRNAVDCKEWIDMRNLILRASQWGMILKDNATALATALPAMFFKVPGGTAEDPCYQLQMAEAGSGLPVTAADCDALVWRGDKWIAEPKGLTYHPLPAPVVVATFAGPGVVAAVMPSYPVAACGEVWGVFQTPMAWTGSTVDGTNLIVKIGSYYLNQGGAVTGINSSGQMARLSGPTTNVTATQSEAGPASASVQLIGYFY